MKKRSKLAFSLVEILVALIAVSCITVALAPVITKRLKANAVTVGADIIDTTENADVSTECLTISPDGKCILCNKAGTVCYTCTEACGGNEYRNDGTCSCHECTNYHEKCIRCNSGSCITCTDGHGVTTGGSCEKCDEGKYVDINGFCALCPEGYYCTDGAKIICPIGSYSLEGSSECINCSDVVTNCIECTQTECTKCKDGFKLEGGNYCRSESVVETFIVPGNHVFQVPDTTTEITATLVSGGAGGGAGSTLDVNRTIVISGAGGVSVNETTFLSKVPEGIYTWDVPIPTINNYFKFTSCGAGGGGGGKGKSEYGGAGGDGGYKENVILQATKNQYTIQIGGGGGKGANDENGSDGECAFGGGGGFNGSSCGVPIGNWGSAGSAKGISGVGGYDPVFGEHAQNGCNGGIGYQDATGGKGSYFGGGGGAGASYGNGGGGGAPTLFVDDYLSITKAYVAAGGGGGGGGGSSSVLGAAGGGGGGVGCGIGADGVKDLGMDGGDAEYAKPGASTIFGATYCSGGSKANQGKNGAMRIWYADYGETGGTGGGAGQVVPEQTVSVTPGETLIITVGRGGQGGKAGYYDSSGTFHPPTVGAGSNEALVSKITRADGYILLTTATSPSQAGAGGGNPDGITAGRAGLITNGRNLSEIAMSGYSNSSGALADTTTGGMGGKTTVEMQENHCTPGDGAIIGVKGSSATGYGGCGGGGGGAGADGGDGVGGYVILRYTE